MWIDIIQAYSDALHVATTQRPVPAPPGDVRRSSREDEARIVATPSPAAWRRLAGWLAPRIRPGGESDAGPTGTPTVLKECG